MRSYTVVLSGDPSGAAVTVTCPAMPGLVVEGENRADALEKASAVMQAWLELADEGGFGPKDETLQLVEAEIGDVLRGRAEEGWPLVIETALVQVQHAVAA